MMRVTDVTLFQLLMSEDGCIGCATPEASPPVPSGYDPTLIIYIPFGKPKVYDLQRACNKVRYSG